MGIYKGKNIEEAIKKGLKDLNVKKEDATIEVLEEGSGGIFGLFSKEARFLSLHYLVRRYGNEIS